MDSFTNSNKHASSNNTKVTIYDKAGNARDCGTSSVQVDKGDPNCSISHNGSTGSWSCSDGGSGISGNTSGSVTMSGSSYTVSHTCYDNAGNSNSCSHTYSYSVCDYVITSYSCEPCTCTYSCPNPNLSTGTYVERACGNNPCPGYCPYPTGRSCSACTSPVYCWS